ncbi:hypothetical protein TIFTF001_011362 [Ficus carica]|uniref:Uncharacterized protein n=1 Tax=Ficus carica TaxID=3494 RepID=A0AA88AAB6_FICCA|nr:hypothetical protein TIFTF001_011362 [Ficus carica]
MLILHSESILDISIVVCNSAKTVLRSKNTGLLSSVQEEFFRLWNATNVNLARVVTRDRGMEGMLYSPCLVLLMAGSEDGPKKEAIVMKNSSHILNRFDFKKQRHMLFNRKTEREGATKGLPFKIPRVYWELKLLQEKRLGPWKYTTVVTRLNRGNRMKGRLALRACFWRIDEKSGSPSPWRCGSGDGPRGEAILMQNHAYIPYRFMVGSEDDPKRSDRDAELYSQ